MKELATQKVSLGEKIGYSMGDAAANLVFQMMMIFQLKFYTDVFGLDGAVAGSILMIGSLSAIVIDPLVGILSDRTKTRWGKFRPWVLWTAIPFCIFYMLAFYNPGIEEKGMVATYATISYVLLMTVYSFNNIPYTSLGGVMTSDIRERTSITTIRFILVTIAQFVVQGMTLPLVNQLGGGDQPKGWTATVILYASVAFILFGVTFFSTKERIQPPPAQKVNIAEDIKDTVSNISWNSMALLTFALGVICLSRYLANKYGKKNTFVVCLSLTAFFTALFYIPSPTDVSMLFILNFMRSLAYAPTIPLLWAMNGDVADHIEYENHRRATGFCFSGIVLALKLGLGFGGAIAGIIISMFGYVSGDAFVQNDSALEGIRLVSSIIPALLFAVGVVALQPVAESVITVSNISIVII